MVQFTKTALTFKFFFDVIFVHMAISIIHELPKIEIYNDETSGLKLSYRYLKNKNKKTIVFLHGYNGNSKSWAFQFKFFKYIS